LCKDRCAKLQPNVFSVAREKQASTASKKSGHAVSKVSSVDSSAKRSEHQQCNSKKNSIEQQEDNIVPQVDKRNDEVCNVTMDHNVTPTPERVAIPKCQLQSEIVKEEVTNILITGSLSSEQDQEENSPAHTKEGELEETIMQVVEDDQLSCDTRERTSLSKVDPLRVQLKEIVVVSQHANLKIIQQEVPSQCMNTSVGDLRYVESCSSAKCGEVTCSDTIQNFSVQHDENSEQKCDQEIENTSNFEGPSNLNMMATHIFSLQDECEKKDATIVSPSASDKSIQDEVHHAPTKLRLQTNVVPSMNIMQRCVVPSAAICDELLDSGAKTLCSNMPLKTQIEGKIDKDESTSTNAN